MRGFLVLLTLLLAGQTAPREVMVLDLTGPAAARPLETGPFRARSFAVVGRARHGGGGGPEQWPIRATLLDITPGPTPERWTVEVRLEALQEVQLPRSLDKEKVDPDPTVRLPSLRQLLFLLELEPGDETRRPPIVETGRTVYGSDLAPGSLFTLRAGESIRVRYAVRAGGLIQQAKPGEPLKVRARVLAMAGAYQHPALRSDNVLEVK